MTLSDDLVDALCGVTAADVTTIAQDVWGSFLAMDLVPHPLGDQAPPLTGRTVTGCVHVTGAWQGSVLLEYGSESAAAAAEAMFGAEPGGLSPEEVSDALGELTNMVGGNIKSLLPGPSTLSIPSVAEGVEYTVRVPGASRLITVPLSSPTGPLLVSIWKV